MKIKDLVALAFGAIFLWTLGATFEFLMSPDSRFLDWLIFRVPSNELYFRLATIAALVLTALVVSRTPSAQKSTLEDLKNIQERYRSLLDHLPVGVYRITSDGRILEASQRFAEILGYGNVRELQKINLNDLYVKKSDRIGHLERLRDSTVFAEFELRRKDGRTVWVRDYPKAIVGAEGTIAYIDGVFVEATGIDAIVRDIAEHRRLETMKGHFISSVTHELRTPLVSIKGYVDYILAKELGLLPEGVKSKIEVVRRNTDKLLELTEDLLNIQRMQNGTFEFKLQTVSVREMLSHCVEEIEPIVKQKNQEIHVDAPNSPLMIQGDQLRLSEVLVNLLHNATKFTPNGGKITIRAEEDASTVTVHVSDTGIGLDKKDLDRVFEPFAVIEKPTYFKGTGLGLSLTKRLIEAHGGKIRVSSAGKGQGANFAFTLPKKQEEWLGVHG